MLLAPLTLKPRKVTKTYNRRGRCFNKYSLYDLINGAKKIIAYENVVPIKSRYSSFQKLKHHTQHVTPLKRNFISKTDDKDDIDRNTMERF